MMSSRRWHTVVPPPPCPVAGPRVSPITWWEGTHGEVYEYNFKKEMAPWGITVISFGLRQSGLSQNEAMKTREKYSGAWGRTWSCWLYGNNLSYNNEHNFKYCGCKYHEYTSRRLQDTSHLEFCSHIQMLSFRFFIKLHFKQGRISFVECKLVVEVSICPCRLPLQDFIHHQSLSLNEP
jgi:hypothetical protein